MFSIECIDGRFTQLSSKSDMLKNGWMVDITDSNGQDRSPTRDIFEEKCKTDTFYGYNGGDEVGRVSATFKGTGKAILSYGNCFSTGYVKVSLNDSEEGRSSPYQNDLVTIQYRKGDVLKIEEIDTAIIKLYYLVLQDCGKLYFCSTILNHYLLRV